MARIVRSLSVFCESFSKCTLSFSYVLFLTSFAFYHINQVGRFARHLLFDFSYFPSVVKCVVQWNIYNQTTLKKHYDNYILLKDVLRHPRRKDVVQALKLRHGPFLETALGHIIYLQTYEKDAWSIFDLMELQHALTDSQLLKLEVKPSDQSCHFLFVGIKDPITFFGKYCDFHCRYS